MADIIINEISQNYSYVIGDSSYCCVALPITASWGPAYAGYTDGQDKEDVLENIVWTRFRANSQGLESFVSTYRGPAANYRLSEDYSYQMAVSLLTAGYDVLVSRLCPGKCSDGWLRRNYYSKISDGWFSGQDIDKDKGNLTLDLHESPLIVETLNPIPIIVNSDHPFVVESNASNFSGYTVTKVGSIPNSTDPTGVYVVGTNSTTITKIVFHLKREENASEATISDWGAVGIVEGAELTFTADKELKTLNGATQGTLKISAKYPGTFGNRIQCSLRRMSSVGTDYWNLVTYIVDTSGVRTAVENLNFVFDIKNSTDNILFIDEIESQFVDIKPTNLSESSIFTKETAGDTKQEERLTIILRSGDDKAASNGTPKEDLDDAIQSACDRYGVSTEKKTVTPDPVTVTTAKTADPAVVIIQGYSVQVRTDDTTNKPVDKIISCVFTPNEGDPSSLVFGVDYDVVINDGVATVTLKSGSSIIPAAAADADDGDTLSIEYRYVDGDNIKCSVDYINELCGHYNRNDVDATTAATWMYLEWIYTNCLDLYDLLHDKLAYNPNRVISPGWDDQNFLRILNTDSYTHNMTTPSPIHLKLMETAYHARCATAYIDLPKSLAKKHVYNESQQATLRGYAQLLARQDLADSDGLFTTHSALFGPWGTYMYVGTSKQQTASPSFLALLIQRSMILNQSLQYEWIQPSSRKNSVNIGKMDYTVSKKYLDKWQPDPDTEGGVGVNAIANIPDLGLSIWGDSTLYENPPATYQALRNLSTRLLVNAIKNVVYKVGISITFQYTNQTAFSSFYVGVTPILDSMVNAGAIGDYKVVIGNDFDAVGMVKANSCVGKIYITPNGTIQHITVDLIALPPQTDLSNYS